MTTYEVMEQRHSVRQFIDKPLEEAAVAELQKEIDAVNQESGLHIQLVKNEPEAFQASKPSYGQFKGCKNYLVIVGPKGKDVEAGYFGERIVLKAQELGINSCWVALTYKKGKAQSNETSGEKRYLVVALGYGETQGVQHKNKPLNEVSDCNATSPEWYKKGIEAALLAPTAMNQQKFKFELKGNKVEAKAGLGFYTKIDLGIAKYHFELGAGNDNFEWV